MRQLSPAGQQAIADIARRHGFSVEATLAMLDAVVRGHGAMAQFSHPEFGGAGQWMRGGMTMVGDMNNHQLKGWVDALCQDLSNLIANPPEAPSRSGVEPAPLGQARPSGFGTSGFGTSGFGDLFMPGSSHVDTWWPGEFGVPSASGSQNGARYAYFAGPRRLVVQQDGRTTVYDTGEHLIGGVSQQQSGRGSLSFSGQHGPVDIESLAVVTGPGAAASRPAPPSPDRPAPVAPSETAAAAPQDPEAVFGAIERLAALREKGIVSDEEFASKKAELLRRV